MATRRDAILNGAIRATELHTQLGLKDKLRSGDGPIDVLAAMNDLGLAVIFRPLSGLLGAYVPLPGVTGILITTRRPLPIQRFTAAHELGHFAFQHEVSTDRDVGYAARGEAGQYDYQEMEADAFASEFLMPKWLIAAHVRRQGWTTREIRIQAHVYQLALRLGVSYEALCWSLQGHGLISPAEGDRLREQELKAAKVAASNGISPNNWHADVWTLREQDDGATLMGGPDDLLILTLREHASAGYQWDLSSAEELGLVIRHDAHFVPPPELVGAALTRRTTLQGDIEGSLRLEQRRAWEARGKAASSLELHLQLHGKESAGLPRVARPSRT
jgi:Zn-dependent peptidase ImmA (M78 family)